MSDSRFHSLLKNALREKRFVIGVEKSGGERYISGIALNQKGEETIVTVPEYKPLINRKVKVVNSDEIFD